MTPLPKDDRDGELPASDGSGAGVSQDQWPDEVTINHEDVYHRYTTPLFLCSTLTPETPLRAGFPSLTRAKGSDSWTILETRRGGWILVGHQ